MLVASFSTNPTDTYLGNFNYCYTGQVPMAPAASQRLFRAGHHELYLRAYVAHDHHRCGAAEHRVEVRSPGGVRGAAAPPLPRPATPRRHAGAFAEVGGLSG